MSAKSMYIAALLGMAMESCKDEAEKVTAMDIESARIDLSARSPAKRLLLSAQVKRAHKLKHNCK